MPERSRIYVSIRRAEARPRAGFTHLAPCAPDRVRGGLVLGLPGRALASASAASKHRSKHHAHTPAAAARPPASASSAACCPRNKLTVESAIQVNLNNDTVRLPIYPGDAPVPATPGQTERVWYVLLDASDNGLAHDLGRQLRPEAGQHWDRRPGGGADGDRGQPHPAAEPLRTGGDPLPGRPGLQPDPDRRPWTDRLPAEELQPRIGRGPRLQPVHQDRRLGRVYNAPIIATGNGVVRRHPPHQHRGPGASTSTSPARRLPVSSPSPTPTCCSSRASTPASRSCT